MSWAPEGKREGENQKPQLLYYPVLRLTEDWKTEADLNNIIGATLIDLSKAFDRLPHNLLLEKL